MNCDLVFEVLTRGPFPSGEPTDASVERHLARCHECRRLAEALRPAVELFHEALADDEDARSLPGYYGAAVAEETSSAAILTAAAWAGRPAMEAPALRSRTRRWRGPQFAAVAQLLGGAGLGAALCLAVAFLFTSASRPERNFGVAASQPGLLSARAASPDEVRNVLASLQLPLACIGVDSDRKPASSKDDRLPSHSAGELLCCTHCHNASESHRPAVSAVALLQREACGACHRWQ
jgi:hypothetical protein